jgi:hypothetical protein
VTGTVLVRDSHGIDIIQPAANILGPDLSHEQCARRQLPSFLTSTAPSSEPTAMPGLQDKSRFRIYFFEGGKSRFTTCCGTSTRSAAGSRRSKLTCCVACPVKRDGIHRSSGWTDAKRLKPLFLYPVGSPRCHGPGRLLATPKATDVINPPINLVMVTENHSAPQRDR